MKYRVNDNELIYLIKENDEYSLELLFNKYQPIIYNICSCYYIKMKNLGIEFNDLLQEGKYALYKASCTFNSCSNVKFYTYFCNCIRNHLNSYYRDLSVKKHSVLNNSYSLDDINYNNYYRDDMNYIFEQDYFVNIKNLFSFRNSVVFELRYNGFNYKEIAILLDLPISTVDGRLCKIRNTLRLYL